MPQTPTKAALWTGRVLSGLISALLLFDAAMKIVRVPMVVEGMAKAGYPAAATVPIGVALLVSTLLYALPRTAALGAILLTGYLGGAVATHVHAGDPLFSHILSPVYVGIVAWGGLYLREPRLRALVPLRRSAD